MDHHWKLLYIHSSITYKKSFNDIYSAKGEKKNTTSKWTTWIIILTLEFKLNFSN